MTDYGFLKMMNLLDLVAVFLEQVVVNPLDVGVFADCHAERFTTERRQFVSIIVYLIPVALGLGLLGLGAFLWSVNSDQYEDLDGAAHRILSDEDRPLQ